MTEREVLIQKIIDVLKQVPADRLRTVYIVVKEIQCSTCQESCLQQHTEG